MSSEDMLPKDLAPLEPIHTLRDDLAESEDKKEPPKINTVAAQQEVNHILHIETPPPPPAPLPTSISIRNLLITLISIMVIAGAAYGIFTTARERSARPPVEAIPAAEQEEQNEMLTYNSKKDISFSSDDLVSRDAVAAKLVKEAVPSGAGVTLYKTSPAVPSLLPILSPTMPGEYQRSLAGESFYGGIIENQQGNFLVIKIDSFERAYAGQLEWEASMGTDLLPLFGTASSSTVHFEDKIIANRDARAAIDQRGNTLFIYGFYRNSAVIFARNEDAFRAVHEMLLRQNL